MLGRAGAKVVVLQQVWGVACAFSHLYFIRFCAVVFAVLVLGDASHGL